MHAISVYLPNIVVLLVGHVALELTSPHTLYSSALDISIIILTLSFRLVSASSVPCFASSIIKFCEIKKFEALVCSVLVRVYQTRRLVSLKMHP